MGFLSNVFWLIVVLAIILGVVGLLSYNRLQALAQRLREAASNTEVAVSKKLSLVNQLIDLVRNYQEFEQFTHLKMSADNTDSLSQAMSQSGQVLAAIQGMAQRFPELKSNTQYDNLARNIQASEEGIATARERYNAAARDYNTVRASIPTVFVARYMGFSEAPFLEFDHSGVLPVSTLRDFKTGDGERLQQMLQGAGTKLADGGKALAASTLQAGRALQDRMQGDTGALPHAVSADADAQGGESGQSEGDTPAESPAEVSYFYLVPGGVPQGPVTLSQLRAMFEAGDIEHDTQAAPAGSASWKHVVTYW